MAVGMRRLACLCGLALALACSADAKPKPARAPVAEQSSPVETAIMAALANGSGWQLPNRPRINETLTGFTIHADGASYGLGHGLALHFEALDVQAVPQSGGTFNVVVDVAGPVTLQAAEGVWATVNPGQHSFRGVWDPAREGFQKLGVTLGMTTIALANGAMITLEQAVGTYGIADGHGDGHFTVTGVQTGLVGAYQGRTADEVILKFRLDNPDTQPVLALDYRHSLPATGLSGMAGEFMPLRMGLVARLDPFPWQGVLSELAPWLVEVASRTPPSPGQMWSALWTHVASALGTANAQMAVERLDARSVGLAANGSGAVNFGAAGPRGTINADLRGINERIGQITSADRRENPMLFPSLALMTVVGDGVNEGGKRFHRYRIELAESGLKVNGRDAGGLKP
ncbi:MAG: hypothetical protein H7Z12_19770 [Rhodospirillaceae bacterium]|nr:hypothetical protein [Rhodospirillales bacterium]